jgi:hypothetical protein
MAMKETERSLRVYFFLAGAIAVLLSLRDWSSVQRIASMGFSLPLDWKVAVYVPIVSRVVIGVGFLIAGVKLPSALLTGVGWIKKLLVASAAMMLVNGALATAILELDAAQAGIGGAAFGILITVYLYRSVTRLSAEAIERAGIPAPPPAAKVV